MCLIAEIIHTCSHEKVAHAAVVSVGPDFAGKVGVTADAHGLSIGAFTARTVRDFEKRVGEPEKQALRALMDRSDQPILTGLRHILEPVMLLEGGDEAHSRRGDQETPASQKTPAPRASRKTVKPAGSPSH